MDPGRTDASAPAPSVDTPRLELEELLVLLLERAEDVRAAQSRLRGLLRTTQLIVGDHGLPDMLRRITETACQLVGAPSGALSVPSPQGAPEELVLAGAELNREELIARLPVDSGLARSLAARPHTPVPSGASLEGPLQPRHPQDEAPVSCRAVPIRVREQDLGTMFLIGHDESRIRAADEELLLSLGATAGVAILNARLFAEAERRQDWMQASTQITRHLLADSGDEPLRAIARRLQQVAGADAVNVVLPTADGERLRVEVATGAGAEELTAVSYPIGGTVSQTVLATAAPVLIDDITRQSGHTVHLSEVVPVGPLMVLPLVGAHRVLGALVVGRFRTRERFTGSDLEMATAFANHAAVALELADARAAKGRVALLEDRDRIARDLHDHVMQRLFGAGLTVESVASGLGEDPRADRLGHVVRDINETITQIRTSIFQLRGPLLPGSDARSRMLGVAAGYRQDLWMKIF